MRVNFDLDGTIVDLYGVENWLPLLCASDPTPYSIAAPMLNLSRLARYLNRLQKRGHELCVVTWLSKNSTPDYDKKVAKAKIDWLKRHLPSVQWDYVHIVPYGTNKWEICQEGILFDDDEKVRNTWGGISYKPTSIFEVLSELTKAG